jgi:putative SOS response-associated peptidase YedK
MCFSAIIEADYEVYVRKLGARIALEDFVQIYYPGMKKTRRPKAMDAAFAKPQTDIEREIKALIDADVREQISALEQDVFAQRKRLAEAERKLQVKETKTATESARIARKKVDWSLGKLSDLKRTEIVEKDSRIFPGWYAPVMVWEDGRRVVKPMRYQCRPHGKPEFYDTKFPGTYNARRDNLEGFWKDLFGFSHGIMLASAFFENVSRHRLEGRELAAGEEDENVVLEFRPRGIETMFAACLWSHWKGKDGAELLSFAAITDEPPDEVAAAGHDRCIIPIKPGNVDAWLNPTRGDLATQYAILDDRERPFYEHRMAA